MISYVIFKYPNLKSLWDFNPSRLQYSFFVNQKFNRKDAKDKQNL